MKKRMVIMIIALVIVFGGIFGWDFIKSRMIANAIAHSERPPVYVATAIAKSTTWQPIIPAVGTFVAINGVDVTSEVSGTVNKILFDSGDVVNAGQPLVKLDDSTDLQDLKNYQAQLKLAKINFERQKDLYARRATSQSLVDSAEAQYQEAQAMVGKTEVLIAKKTISAPFAGRIGIRQVNLGQYVSPGTGLVTLQSFNPIHVQFSLPEQDLKNLHVGQTVEVRVDAYPDEVFKSKITAINSKVDPNTRNILIQATLPNPDHKLYPGMFANVAVLLPTENQVVTVPQTAIAYSLYGDIVYFVKQNGTNKKGQPILVADRAFVKVGQRRGGQVAIISGVKPNQEVIIAGQLKLEPGVRIAINNSVNIAGNAENVGGQAE